MSKRSRWARLECKTADEATNIQQALDHPEIRAFLGIVGVLLQLGEGNRTRVLEFINDIANAEAGRVRIETRGQRHDVEASHELPSVVSRR